ncbi:MAG: amidohydrolase [Gemmobacter sp.]|nr:amidohydrolase [Gemmobacter sp.]
MPVKNRLAEMQPEIAGWRRDIHAHPEILFETHRTSALVADKLREFGCDEVVTGIGRTGVVGIIRGRATTSGKTIGLRADMDALPIIEATGLDYASTTPGAMHACGHDGHTAMLLGAAKYLAETRNFDGSVAVIFQPAEEGGGGGREMVRRRHDGPLRHHRGLRHAQHAGASRWAVSRSAPGSSSPRPTPSRCAFSGKGGHAAKPQERSTPP